jgi:hypothetical protein
VQFLQLRVGAHDDRQLLLDDAELHTRIAAVALMLIMVSVGSTSAPTGWR